MPILHIKKLILALEAYFQDGPKQAAATCSLFAMPTLSSVCPYARTLGNPSFATP